MTPGRIVTWSLTVILASVAAVIGTAAIAVVWALIKASV